MQVCRSTSTMPSARLNEAPVGQTSTQGGSAQCWHIIGSERTSPRTSLRSILRIHWESVTALPPESPFSLSQAVTQALQPLAQRFMSTSRPQRTVAGAGSLGRAALRELVQRDARRERDAGERGRLPQELPAAVIHPHGRARPLAATAAVAAGLSAWHSKQSSVTPA